MASANISKAFSPLRSLRKEITRYPRQRHVHLLASTINNTTLKLVHPQLSRQSRPQRLNAALFPSLSHKNTRTISSQTTDIVFPDPARPDLFYHFVYPPTPLSHTTPAFALSFLKPTPPSVDSPTIIGWLPAKTYATDSPDSAGSSKAQDTSTLQDFVVNQKFIDLLHETIMSALEQDLDDIWRASATALGKGWMHIHDQRNVPALGRIGDPDDILASVLVEDGKILPGTYQPMPSYRMCTVDGVLQLTPGLAKHLEENLIKITNDGRRRR